MRPTNCSGRQSGKPRRRPGWDHPLRAMQGFWCEPHVGRKPGMGFARVVRHGGWRRWRALTGGDGGSFSRAIEEEDRPAGMHLVTGYVAARIRICGSSSSDRDAGDGMRRLVEMVVASVVQ